jgi:hypothetical protein
VVIGFSRNDLIGLELLGALMKMGKPNRQVRFSDPTIQPTELGLHRWLAIQKTIPQLGWFGCCQRGSQPLSHRHWWL